MRPIYESGVFDYDFDKLWNSIPWIRVAPRDECWMNDFGLQYTYGSGRGVRTYDPVPISEPVRYAMDVVNAMYDSTLDVCFINGYRDCRDQLGWHSDDSPEVDPEAPIAVVSFGAEREIWIKPQGAKGEVPPEDRFLLGDGSVFIMPAGFQETHYHKIPKHSAECGPRISLTFRKYTN